MKVIVIERQLRAGDTEKTSKVSTMLARKLILPAACAFVCLASLLFIILGCDSSPVPKEDLVSTGERDGFDAYSTSMNDSASLDMEGQHDVAPPKDLNLLEHVYNDSVSLDMGGQHDTEPPGDLNLLDRAYDADFTNDAMQVDLSNPNDRFQRDRISFDHALDIESGQHDVINDQILSDIALDTWDGAICLDDGINDLGREDSKPHDVLSQETKIDFLSRTDAEPQDMEATEVTRPDVFDNEVDGGPTVEINCLNGRDEDGDGLTDCADPDCAGQRCAQNEATCQNGACLCPDGEPCVLWSAIIAPWWAEISYINLGDIDGDAKLEVVFSSVEWFKWSTELLVAINGEDGSTLWEAPFSNSYSQSLPALGDVDGDDRLEVIALSGSVVHQYHAVNGEDGSLLWVLESDSYDGWPILGDVNGDGQLDIIVFDYLYTYALNGRDGSPLWSVSTPEGYFIPFSVGDVNGDGWLEVMTSGEWDSGGERDSGVAALNGEDGSLLWSTAISGSSYPNSLGDIDGDGLLEILVDNVDRDDATDQYVTTLYVLNGEDGSFLWSFQLIFFEYAIGPILGELDGDEYLEVLVRAHDEEGNRILLALNGEDGSVLWSSTLGDHEDFDYHSSPIAGDVDGDGKLEVLVTSYKPDGDHYSNIAALNGEDGSLLWTFDTGSSFSNFAALGDLDGDGRLEVIAESHDGDFNGFFVLSTYAPLPPPELLSWPQQQHDLRLTGNINGPDL